MLQAHKNIDVLPWITLILVYYTPSDPMGMPLDKDIVKFVLAVHAIVAEAIPITKSIQKGWI